jgi:hypothetical protein
MLRQKQVEGKGDAFFIHILHMLYSVQLLKSGGVI